MNHMELTTFSDAVTAVSQLGSTCSLVLTDNATQGSGIKMMRLVNKQLSIAMLGVVQGYTLNLNGHGVSLLKEMTLLQVTKLSCLRVGVSHDNDDETPGAIISWDTHMLHLSCFIHGMGAAIMGLTRLELDVLCVGSSSAEAVTLLLSQLASSCPALQQLRITGNIGRGLLLAFGASCSKLSCLEVMEGVSGTALHQLHLILPNLTHCKVAEPPQSGFFGLTSPVCLMLLSCASLTSLDVGAQTLTDPMWQALPSCLRKLHCTLGNEEPPTGLKTMESLDHLCCYCPPKSNHVWLLSLVGVLRFSPNLKSVMVSGYGKASQGSSLVAEVFVRCGSCSIQDIVYLLHRLASGLVGTSTLCSGGFCAGLNLSLHLSTTVDDKNRAYADYSECLADLPLLPAFTGVMLASYSAERCVPALAQRISAVFPNITALALDIPQCINNRNLQHFRCLTALQQLYFEEAEVTTLSLAALCTHMSNLQMLRLRGCEQVSVAEGEQLQILLQDWGCAAQVMVED